MSKELSPEQLATMVSAVTEMMLGFAFTVGKGNVSPEYWRAVRLGFGEDGPIITFATDPDSCTALASAMFAMDESELEPEMIDDSLKELVNMAAGQIKAALGIDEPLGLPHLLDEEEVRHLTTKTLVGLESGAMNISVQVRDD